MIKDHPDNVKLLEEFNQFITQDDVKDAFHVLVGAGAASKNFLCYLTSSSKKVINFSTSDNKLPFAFIINKGWLLFYIREHAVESNQYSIDKIRKDFPDVDKNPKGEWTFKVFNREDALQVVKDILGHWTNTNQD